MSGLHHLAKDSFSVKRPMFASKLVPVQLASSGETEEAGFGTA
jgi:hypothetical protein